MSRLRLGAWMLAAGGCAGAPVAQPLVTHAVPPPSSSGDNSGHAAPSVASRAAATPAPSARAASSGLDAWFLNPDWTTVNGRPIKGMSGESVDVHGANVEALSPSCRSLYDRFAKKVPGRYSFVCAHSPSGETWASIASLTLPPDKDTDEAPGTWQLVVVRGNKVLKSPPQRFTLFAGHAGGACQTDPAVCLQYGHFAGLLEPVGFVFLDVDKQPPSEAFVIGTQEFDNSAAQEFAITLWRLGEGAVQLDELSQHARIGGLADCNGDQVPEVAVNPYWSEAGGFELTFGAHYRGTAERWTELLTLRKTGGFSNDDDLARRYAARLCPTPPKNLLAGAPTSWPGEIHCAKLWCQTSDLATRLESVCKSPQDDESAAFCKANLSVLERMVHTAVPCLLPTPSATPLPRGCFDQAMADGE